MPGIGSLSGLQNRSPVRCLSIAIRDEVGIDGGGNVFVVVRIRNLFGIDIGHFQLAIYQVLKDIFFCRDQVFQA